MPTYSDASKNKLLTCDPRLQKLFNEAIDKIDITIVCGYREEEEQNIAFASGASKKKYPFSKHNIMPSMAVDVYPYKTGYKQNEAFYFLAGVIEVLAIYQGIKIRWGGDWDSDQDFKDQSFNDLCHFELVETDYDNSVMTLTSSHMPGMTMPSALPRVDD